MIRQIAGYLELAAVLLAGGVIYLRPDLAPWPLLVAPVFWLARLTRQGLNGWRAHLITGLDGWVLLFLLSAGVAWWATYDRGLGLTIFGPGGDYKFWLICAAAAIYFAVARLPGQRAAWVTLAGLGFFGVLVALYFLLTRDFSAATAKFPFFDRLGELIQSFTPQVGTLTAGREMHPNVAGGLAAMFFPALLQTALAGWRRLPARWVGRLVLAASLACLPLLAVGIVLSSSRGAWIGLAAALGGWMGWALLGKTFERRGMSRETSLRRRARLAVVLLAAAMPLGLLALWLAGQTASAGAPEGSLFSRLELLQNSYLLVQAAPFTGSGLGTFPMVYSAYVLLIHVPYTSHAHNIFMNVLLSQGWPGLAIYAGMLLVALALLYRVALRVEGRWPLAGIMAMLVVSVVHGFVDDPLYGSRALLVWFIPIGMAACAARGEGVTLSGLVAARSARRAALAAGAVVVVLAIFFWQSLAAAFSTNLGLVSQVKTELAQYDPDRFTERTLDQVRRESDLTGSLSYYSQALQRQPGQLAAGQRLVDLDLALGKYDAALVESERLWAAGHRDRATRLIYGSALVANAQPQAAVEVMGGLSWAEERLAYEAWYRYYIHEDFARAADAYRAILLLDPANETAGYWLAEAEKKVP